MTSVAVCGHRLLRFPVTIETRRVIGRNGFERRCPRSMTEATVVVSDVLMHVMRKVDLELQLRGRIAKRVTHVVTGRGLRMTNGADRRPRAAKELRTVTAHACVVTRVIRDIGKLDLMTYIAGRFVLRS